LLRFVKQNVEMGSIESHFNALGPSTPLLQLISKSPISRLNKGAQQTLVLQ